MYRLRWSADQAKRWTDNPHGIILDRKTCDWVIDDKRDTAIWWTHGEVADGPKSAHFPGKEQQCQTK